MSDDLDFFADLDAAIKSDLDVEIERLVKELTYGSQQYYANGKSPYSDKEWDTKYYRLAEIDPNNPILAEVGHGYDVDSEIEDSPDAIKYIHPIIAGSITKTKDINLIKSKIGKKSKWSIKLDGNAMFNYYGHGKLLNSSTRGKNNIGIDKTHKMKLIIPTNIPVNLEHFVVKGEVVIDKKDYTVENGFDVTKSSRNAVAGLLNRKEGWEEQFKFLKFVAYIFEDIKTKKSIENDYVWSDWFEVEEQKDCSIFLNTPIDDFYEMYKLDHKYDSDGTVFRFDDMSMLALKYDDESGSTRLNKPEMTIGIDQRLTPVGDLKPINLCGSTIKKVSFGSFNKLQSLGLWPTPIEANVEIIKANEIIPKVISAQIIISADKNKPFHYPLCPVCGTESKPKGKHVFCVNPKCENIEKSRLYKFSSFFYPQGFSDSKAEKVFKFHGISTIIDLLKFNYKKYDFTAIPGIGSSDNILIMMFFDKLSKKIDSKIIYQSVITSCGKTYSKEIVKSGFIISDVWNEKYEPIKQLKNFNSAVIEEIIEKKELIKKICELREVVDDVPKNIVGSFCITNARFSPEQLERLSSKGWVEDTSVKKTTTVLITNDIDNITGKVEKARKYGIDVVEIAQFFEQYIDDEE